MLICSRADLGLLHPTAATSGHDTRCVSSSLHFARHDALMQLQPETAQMSPRVPQREFFFFFFFTSAYPSKQKAEEGFQCPAFEAQWNVGNFDTPNWMEKHCLLCSDTVATLREHNVRPHYQTTHSSK